MGDLAWLIRKQLEGGRRGDPIGNFPIYPRKPAFGSEDIILPNTQIKAAIPVIIGLNPGLTAPENLEDSASRSRWREKYKELYSIIERAPAGCSDTAAIRRIMGKGRDY